MFDFNKIENSHFLKKLYPHGLDFKGFISDVSFSYNGPSILISFHTSQMPDVLPKKWEDGVNTLLIVVEFIEIEDFNFLEFGRNNNVSLLHDNRDDINHLKIIGGDFDLSFTSRWITIKSVSPYCN